MAQYNITLLYVRIQLHLRFRIRQVPPSAPKMASYSVETFLDLFGDDVIVKVDFVAEGLVTGVGFRMSVKHTADSLGLRGWVAHSSAGNVIGTVEGPYEMVQRFKTWIAIKGPPRADIDNVRFNNESWKQAYDLEDSPFNVVFVY